MRPSLGYVGVRTVPRRVVSWLSGSQTCAGRVAASNDLSTGCEAWGRSHQHAGKRDGRHRRGVGCNKSMGNLRTGTARSRRGDGEYADDVEIAEAEAR